MTLRIEITRLRQAEYRAAGWRVLLEGKAGAQAHCYTLDGDGTRELTYDESERDVDNLARLLAVGAISGCELAISKGAEDALRRALAHPFSVAPLTPTAPTKKARKVKP